jgi:Ser-tRNA(Ala) deacylase AlaX
MTEKLYDADPYLGEASARVAHRQEHNGRWRLRLERTIFRPEGGGQPADAGTINGQPLLALEEEDGDVVHVLERDPGPGDAALRLDFPRRYDHMQQHTAQHLLSQLLLRRFAAATLSFAIGPEHSSIETGRPAYSDEEVRELEEECARLAWAALPVRVFSSDDPASLALRKPPKKGGLIRVVEIAGYDRSACGGTHVRSSAELAPLKVLRVERVRANARLYYAAGGRALRDHRLKHDLALRLQRLITQPLDEIPAQLEALQRERDGLRRELRRARRREMEREAAQAAAGAETLVRREFAACEPEELRAFAAAVAAAGRHVLACSQPVAGAGAAHVVVARGRGDADLRALAAPLFALLAGKGGGSAAMLEGRSGDLSRLSEAAELLRRHLG